MENKTKLKIFISVGLALLAFYFWWPVLAENSGRGLKIYFFDVGQGDAIFIETPQRQQVLIDGGPNSKIIERLSRVLPFYDREIDLVILTHPHLDHVSGLIEVLQRYKIEKIMQTGVNYSTAQHQEFQKLLKEKEIPIIIAQAGQRLIFSEDIFMDILAPLENYQGRFLKNVHDSAIVSRLIYASTSVLLTSDIEKNTESKLALFYGPKLKSDILKAAHHGSKTSTTEKFLDQIKPDIIVISSGRKNPYGHPHQDVLKRLADFGIEVFRTDFDGDIRFISNGKNFYNF